MRSNTSGNWVCTNTYGHAVYVVQHIITLETGCDI